MKQIEDGFYHYALAGKILERIGCRINMGHVELNICHGELDCISFVWRFAPRKFCANEAHYMIGYGMTVDDILAVRDINSVADCIWAEWQAQVRELMGEQHND